METFINALQLIFGADNELRQIIGVTLQMSLTSTTISSLIGIPIGIFLGLYKFTGKSFVMRIINTLMAMPPVVAGLIVFMILSRQGPLGSFGLLFSVTAMVIAQVLLITPIIAGLTASLVGTKAPQMLETTAGIALSRRQELLLMINECKSQLVFFFLTGFGRAIAEVGAVHLVGGNVQFKTRVMTTAIMLETNKGNFEFAIALGVVLLIIAFVVNSIGYRFQGEKK
ncbi:MAG: ABC transporter permease [Bacillota bacterium]|jgi:tungstate transport system permease protein